MISRKVVREKQANWCATSDMGLIIERTLEFELVNMFASGNIISARNSSFAGGAGEHCWLRLDAALSEVDFPHFEGDYQFKARTHWIIERPQPTR